MTKIATFSLKILLNFHPYQLGHLNYIITEEVNSVAILNTCKYFSNCARQDSKYEELLFWVMDLDELRLAGRSESSISPRKKRFYNNCVGVM